MKPFLALLVALSGILALTGTAAATYSPGPCATKSPPVVLDKTAVWKPSPCPSASASPTPSTKTSPTTVPTPTPTATPPPPALQLAPTAPPAPPVTGDGSACCAKPVANHSNTSLWWIGLLLVGALVVIVAGFRLLSRRLGSR